MNKLQAALHTLSLALCVALAAAVWALSERPTPAPAASPASSSSGQPPAARIPKRDPADADRLTRLEEEISALKARLGRSPASQPTAPSAASAPAADAASSATAVLAALEDPKVQARLQALSQAQMEEDFDMTRQLFKGLTLTEAQREGMHKLFEKSMMEVDAVFQRMRREKLTPDQAKLALDQQRLEADKQALALLGTDLYQAYQERIKPLRESTDQMLQHRGDGRAMMFWGTGGGDTVRLIQPGEGPGAPDR